MSSSQQKMTTAEDLMRLLERHLELKRQLRCVFIEMNSMVPVLAGPPTAPNRSPARRIQPLETTSSPSWTGLDCIQSIPLSQQMPIKSTSSVPSLIHSVGFDASSAGIINGMDEADVGHPSSKTTRIPMANNYNNNPSSRFIEVAVEQLLEESMQSLDETPQKSYQNGSASGEEDQTTISLANVVKTIKNELDNVEKSLKRFEEKDEIVSTKDQPQQLQPKQDQDVCVMAREEELTDNTKELCAVDFEPSTTKIIASSDFDCDNMSLGMSTVGVAGIQTPVKPARKPSIMNEHALLLSQRMMDGDVDKKHQLAEIISLASEQLIQSMSSAISSIESKLNGPDDLDQQQQQPQQLQEPFYHSMLESTNLVDNAVKSTSVPGIVQANQVIKESFLSASSSSLDALKVKEEIDLDLNAAGDDVQELENDEEKIPEEDQEEKKKKNPSKQQEETCVVGAIECADEHDDQSTVLIEKEESNNEDEVEPVIFKSCCGKDDVQTIECNKQESTQALVTRLMMTTPTTEEEVTITTTLMTLSKIEQSGEEEEFVVREGNVDSSSLSLNDSQQQQEVFEIFSPNNHGSFKHGDFGFSNLDDDQQQQQEQENTETLDQNYKMMRSMDEQLEQDLMKKENETTLCINDHENDEIKVAVPDVIEEEKLSESNLFMNHDELVVEPIQSNEEQVQEDASVNVVEEKETNHNNIAVVVVHESMDGPVVVAGDVRDDEKASNYEFMCSSNNNNNSNSNIQHDNCNIVKVDLECTTEEAKKNQQLDVVVVAEEETRPVVDELAHDVVIGDDEVEQNAGSSTSTLNLEASKNHFLVADVDDKAIKDDDVPSMNNNHDKAKEENKLDDDDDVENFSNKACINQLPGSDDSTMANKNVVKSPSKKNKSVHLQIIPHEEEEVTALKEEEEADNHDAENVSQRDNSILSKGHSTAIIGAEMSSSGVASFDESGFVNKDKDWKKKFKQSLRVMPVFEPANANRKLALFDPTQSQPQPKEDYNIARTTVQPLPALGTSALMHPSAQQDAVVTELAAALKGRLRSMKSLAITE